jgi:hypothetical protein
LGFARLAPDHPQHRIAALRIDLACFAALNDVSHLRVLGAVLNTATRCNFEPFGALHGWGWPVAQIRSLTPDRRVGNPKKSKSSGWVAEESSD